MRVRETCDQLCDREAAVYNMCVECAPLSWVVRVLENDRDTLSEAEVARLIERLAEDAQRICAGCGDYVKDLDRADVDGENRFGHEGCLEVLNRPVSGGTDRDGEESGSE